MYCRKDPNIKESSLGNSLSEQSMSEQSMHSAMGFLDVAGLSLNWWVGDRMLGAVKDYEKTKAMEGEF